MDALARRNRALRAPREGPDPDAAAGFRADGTTERGPADQSSSAASPERFGDETTPPDIEGASHRPRAPAADAAGAVGPEMRDPAPARAAPRVGRAARPARRRIGLIAGAVAAVALLALGSSYFLADRGTDRAVGAAEPAVPDDEPTMPAIASLGGDAHYSLPLGTPIIFPPREDVALSTAIHLPADHRPDPLPDDASAHVVPLESADREADSAPLAGAGEADPEQAEGALALDDARRRDIQRRLTIAGFDAGTPDGIFGPRTRSAISRWQQGQGRPVTGFLDADQLGALERETGEGIRGSAGAPR